MMTICTGACWSPARLLEEDMITPERPYAHYVVIKEQTKATYFGNAPLLWRPSTLLSKDPTGSVPNIAGTKLMRNVEHYIGEG